MVCIFQYEYIKYIAKLYIPKIPSVKLYFEYLLPEPNFANLFISEVFIIFISFKNAFAALFLFFLCL